MCAKHKLYHRDCKNCGQAFTTKNRKTLCCSGECGTRAWQNGLPKAECQACKQTYQTTSLGQIYCSPECRPAQVATERSGECTQCGSEYTTFTGRKTCSTKCATAAHAEHSQSLWSDLRRGYETEDADMFFAALIADCDTDSATGCWTWARPGSKFGYPVTRFGAKNVALHRASLEMAEGRTLGVLHAHHTCANTMCVNPSHIEPATAADNTLEMMARNSYIARIAELEAAIADMAPGHEVLARVPAN